jgi:hypothetical protein
MSTPYNNQWVLGRPRRHRRERAALSSALRPASDQPRPERQERTERRDRRGPHDSGRENRHRVHPPRGFDPALTGGVTRKPPRWIDRDI